MSDEPSGETPEEREEEDAVVLSPRRANRYSQIMERLFSAGYEEGKQSVPFHRDDMRPIADTLGIALPDNLGDVVYSFRYRTPLPAAIRKTAPEGMIWVIRPTGQSRYKFDLIKDPNMTPRENMVVVKVPDATPGLVTKYALDDEQGLLARLRYNRLIDIFTGLVCYSLQNHMRTTVKGMGQVETDEIYIGVDDWGNHFVMPVQAKGGKDKLGVVQIEQDIALCRQKLPGVTCRPIAAQFMSGGVIALFEFVEIGGEVQMVREMHYRLVLPDQLTPEDLATYRKLSQLPSPPPPAPPSP